MLSAIRQFINNILRIVMSDQNLLLSNFDIIGICKHLKIKLNGVLSKDEFNNIIPETGCYVCNLQDSDKGNGTHWTCIVIQETYIIYYDPFGISMPRPIEYFIMKMKKRPIYVSEDQIQTMNSVFCGYYCIYFMYFCTVLHRTVLNGHYVLDNHNAIFSLDNRHLNDRIIQKLIKQLLL